MDASPSIHSLLDQIRDDGYAVVPNLLSSSQITKMREELAPVLATAPFGRNDFEGFRSQRVYALLAKAPSTSELVAHPTVLALLDELLHPTYLLSAHIAINVHPGETSQMLHADDGYCALPRPRPHVGVSVVWALDDFTAENGATEVLPGSHRFGLDKPDPDDPRILAIEMPAGSAVVFLGTTYHRGGANTSHEVRLGITPQYCEPWMRPIETMTLAVPPPVAATLPERVQALLGYGLYPPFIGYVDGRDPRRLIEAAVSGDS
jgi:ectoine hydroxylase-related dioxygenase (phytanoyl-CoA dioxygenase family)